MIAIDSVDRHRVQRRVNHMSRVFSILTWEVKRVFLGAHTPSEQKWVCALVLFLLPLCGFVFHETRLTSGFSFFFHGNVFYIRGERDDQTTQRDDREDKSIEYAHMGNVWDARNHNRGIFCGQWNMIDGGGGGGGGTDVSPGTGGGELG